MKIIVNNKAEFDSIINQLKHELDQKEINQAAINLSKGIKIKGWFSINFIIDIVLFAGSILTAILLRRWSNWLILFVIPLLFLHY